MPKLLKDLHIHSDVQLGWGIPKCHYPMHKVPCQAPHSLNFKPVVGRTDGEGIEWSWAEMNHIANCTKEMGPGSWHDMINDHFEHHNFKRYVSLGKAFTFLIIDCTLTIFSGKTLHCWLTLAIPEQKHQQVIFKKTFHHCSRRMGWRRNGWRWSWSGRKTQRNQIHIFLRWPVCFFTISYQVDDRLIVFRCLPRRSEATTNWGRKVCSNYWHASATWYQTYGLYFTGSCGRRISVSNLLHFWLKISANTCV